MPVPNIPTDYTTLIEDAKADLDACRVLSSKSGKTPWEAAVLIALNRIANALEARNA